MEETEKQMQVIVHEMEYKGGQMVSDLRLRHYSNSDYRKYRRVYEECFHDMRAALQRFPVDICASREKLEQEKDNIYILEVDGKLIGSVAIYGNEIDDLIVAKDFQWRDHGEALLQFAVSSLQRSHIAPIILHVADWNQGAIKMYLKNGFVIVGTEVVE